MFCKLTNIRYIYPNLDSLTTQNEIKLKSLFNALLPGSIVTASWLEKKGLSRNLQKHYLKNGWLEALGRGAYMRPGDKVLWQNGVHTLQNQNELQICVGALTALSLQGYSHYFRLGKETSFLFSPYKENLPKWFLSFDWGSSILHQQTSFLPYDIAIIEHSTINTTIRISTPERAILECLYLAPDKLDLVECYHIFEGLVNLKPKLVQELLNKCSSIKVKRLFLYMANKAQHQWLSFLDLNNIDLGNGNRSLTKNGVYDSNYQLTIPKELAQL